MGWIVALPALVALYVINKKFKGKGKAKKIIAIVTMVVAGLAGVGLTFTFLGSWTATVVGWIGRAITDVSGDDLTRAVPLALTLLAILGAAADVAFDKKADKFAQFSMVLLPTLLVLVVGGALHKTGGGAVDSINQQARMFMTRLGG